MCPNNDPLPATPEQLEQYALGTLPEEVRSRLEAQMKSDPALRAETRLVFAYCSALRTGLMDERGASEGQTAVDDFQLAAYLDGALASADQSAFEARLASDPRLLGRVVALFRETQSVMDEDSEVVLAEEFLAGETVPFVKREPDASQDIPNSYAELEAAVEERKRRYLQFGN